MNKIKTSQSRAHKKCKNCNHALHKHKYDGCRDTIGNLYEVPSECTCKEFVKDNPKIRNDNKTD